MRGKICKGVCAKYKAKKPKKGGRFVAGQKSCVSCKVFLYWNGQYCPCCNRRLRNRPRTRAQKKVFLINRI